MSKSRIQKKVFPCGHSGFGRYCHFCRQIAELMKSGMTKEQAIREIKRLSAAPAASSCSESTGCPPDSADLRSNQPSNGVSKIARIEIRPAREVFGENARNPDRPSVVVWTENGARFVTMVPLGAVYIDGDLKILDPIKYQRSISYMEDGKLKSKFGAFVAKYGSWPRIGLTVNTLTNGRGYLTIDTNSPQGGGC